MPSRTSSDDTLRAGHPAASAHPAPVPVNHIDPKSRISNETDYTHLSRFQFIFSFALVTSLFFLWGLSYGLLDVLNKHFLTIFGLTKTQSTLLQFAYFVAYLVVAPPMGIFMRRYGYKKGIHIGLSLFSFGAVMFWPSAHFRKYGMFVAFTFIAASGLATLETAANSYICVLGPPKYSALRLTFAQSFNGVATVIGPIIAAYTFFNGENQYSLGTVQYVYLALAVFALLLNIGLFFAKLPAIRQVISDEQHDQLSKEGFFKQYHTIFGFLAEWFYVGAQVAVASFAIFYITEQPGISPAISSSTASNMFSGCQAAFTVGRFLGVWYLKYIDPAFALFVNGLLLCLFSILTATVTGKGGIACLFLVFFCESICYPVIFSVATADLGPYAKIGSGLIAAGVSGGAVYPTFQGLVSDHVSSHRSYFIPLTGFIPLTAYGCAMWITRSHKYADKITIWGKHTALAVEGPTEPEVVEEVEKARDVEMQEDKQKRQAQHIERRREETEWSVRPYES